MSISSKSVIHYTTKLEYLQGILKNQGFRLKYCLENIDIQMHKPLPMAVPMVSFCDIPLSEIKNHVDSYGSYAIGLSKTWAKHSALNPVLYLEKTSKISGTIAKQLNRVMELRKAGKVDKVLQAEVLRLLLYCKNYEGPLKHGKIDDDNYCFYNEREWRFVADKDFLGGEKSLIWGDIYIADKDQFNEKIKEKYLNFQFSDISYIIVDDEGDIPEILTTLNEVFEDICTSKQLKILSTRIITKNQIFNDF